LLSEGKKVIGDPLASIPLRQSPLPIVGNCTSVVFETKMVVDALRFKQSFAMVIDHG